MRALARRRRRGAARRRRRSPPTATGVKALPGFGAHREHGRLRPRRRSLHESVPGGACTSVPAGASNDLVAEREPRGAAQHDVQLFRARSRSRCALDHVVALACWPTQTFDPNGRKPRRRRNGRRIWRARGRRQTVEVVDREDLVPGPVVHRAHRARSSRSTTGSIRSTPSTAPRGSRCPPRRASACSSAPVVAELREALGQLGARASSSTSSHSSRGVLPKSRSVQRVDARELRDRLLVVVDAQVDEHVAEARHTRRRARRRGAPPTAARAGRHRPPARRRGTRSAARRAAALRSPRRSSASAATVSSPTRMFPCAANPGPVRPPAQVMQPAPV